MPEKNSVIRAGEIWNTRQPNPFPCGKCRRTGRFREPGWVFNCSLVILLLQLIIGRNQVPVNRFRPFLCAWVNRPAITPLLRIMPMRNSLPSQLNGVQRIRYPGLILRCHFKYRQKYLVFPVILFIRDHDLHGLMDLIDPVEVFP